ncbi:MAG: chlorite dismutase family protein [Polyangiaceae bacterium]
MSEQGAGRPSLPEIDVREKGAEKDGERQYMDRRLFMQLLVFNVERETHPEDAIRRLGKTLRKRDAAGTIYKDVNNPRGIGLLTWSEDPEFFATTLRDALCDDKNDSLDLCPDFTMIGRSYSSGFEQDLPYWLINRPIETVTNPDWPWAVWYPLRRSGAFEQLEGREKGGILHEHALIGRAYGEKNLAHDVRLACHGLDYKDNEFLIGLIGENLYPLSHVVQSMRKTKQTSQYISQMGPFWVGHMAWTSRGG